MSMAVLDSRCENEGCGRVVTDFGRSLPNMRAHKRKCDAATVAQREEVRAIERRGGSSRSAWSSASVRDAGRK